MVNMIPSFLHSSNHSNDLEMELSFVLSRTLVTVMSSRYGVLGESHMAYRFCSVDTTYWEDPIRRIGYESASTIVEIDLTWSLGLVLVELASIEARIFLIKLDVSSCLFADSLINLLRVSSIDCLHSWYEGFALFLW
ncbi:hypothetical protein Tco_0773289 [Tanacetum coccineum]|uniref:Protein kinase domain-containing protein n=1 Tax=Tanacetum coccineum TaxID=301880 RepID=A0ABQ4ZPD0_9ASTR